MINLLLNSCLQDLSLHYTLEKWNVQKFYKWKIKVCNNKTIQWLIWDWTMCCVFVFVLFFHKKHTLKTTHWKYLLLSRCKVFSEASMYSLSYKTTAIPCATKRVLSNIYFPLISILFFKYFKSWKIDFYFKIVNPKVLLKSKEYSPQNFGQSIYSSKVSRICTVFLFLPSPFWTGGYLQGNKKRYLRACWN